MLKLSYLIKGLILVIPLLGCSQGESGEATNYLKESRQINQLSDSIGIDETTTETEPNFEIQFVREATYGTTDDVIVGIMGPVTVDRNGRVFITDRNQITVHVFQHDGNYLTSLGNQGRGPGEFMGITPNTTITIYSNQFYITDQADAHLQFPYRMHEFSLEDLTFSRTIDLLAGNKAEIEELDGSYPEGYYSKRIYPLIGDKFLVSYLRSPNEYQDEVSYIYYVVQDTSGSIISDPVLKQKDRTNLITEVILPDMYYTAIHSFPFFGKSLLTVSKDNFLYAVNDSKKFNIDIYTMEGKHVRSVEHFFENIPFNKNEILDYYEKTNYMQRLGDGVALKMIREAENLPEIWPAIEEMLIDDDNRLWVSTIVEDFDIYEWWVLKETGELVTRFEWPRDEPIEVVKNGYMYTRETDEETGLQQVVKYRIEFEGG